VTWWRVDATIEGLAPVVLSVRKPCALRLEAHRRLLHSFICLRSDIVLARYMSDVSSVAVPQSLWPGSEAVAVFCRFCDVLNSINAHEILLKMFMRSSRKMRSPPC